MKYLVDATFRDSGDAKAFGCGGATFGKYLPIFIFP